MSWLAEPPVASPRMDRRDVVVGIVAVFAVEIALAWVDTLLRTGLETSSGVPG